MGSSAGQGNLGNRPTGRTCLYKTTPIVTRVLLGRRREGDQVLQCVLRHVSWRVAPRRLYRYDSPHEGVHDPRPQVRTPLLPSCMRSDRHSRLCTSDGVLNPSGVRFGYVACSSIPNFRRASMTRYAWASVDRRIKTSVCYCSSRCARGKNWTRNSRRQSFRDLWTSFTERAECGAAVRGCAQASYAYVHDHITEQGDIATTN